jgi:hypothetical protein
LFDVRDYQTAFAIAAALPVVGYLVWMTLHTLPRRKTA